MTVQTARTAPVPLSASLPAIDLRVVVAAGLAIATIVGVVVAPAITFFVALAVVTVFGLDRAGRAADEVFTGLVAR